MKPLVLHIPHPRSGSSTGDKSYTFCKRMVRKNRVANVNEAPNCKYCLKEIKRK